MERTYICPGSSFALPDSGGHVKNEALSSKTWSDEVQNHHVDHVTMLIFFVNSETCLTFFTTIPPPNFTNTVSDRLAHVFVQISCSSTAHPVQEKGTF